jgi:radical SAM superfamily enzyme YgiQ (UPF0313 family)
MDCQKPIIFKLIHCGNTSLVNTRDTQEKNIFFMPMGIFALAQMLKQDGVDVEIIHSDLEQESLQGENSIWQNTTAVGFDCHWINQSVSVIETATALKRLYPHLYIVIGGFSASIFAKEILSDYHCVDSVICGDAEKPLLALSRLLRGKADESQFATVPNLVWKDAQHNIHDNGITYRATNDDLEACDFAALDLLRNKDHYRKRSIYWTHFAPQFFAPLNFAPVFFLEIGRGCSYDCLFCGGSAKAQFAINKRTKCAHRSVDAVMGTIEKAKSFGFKTFLSDSEFEQSEAWYLELFKHIHNTQRDVWFVYSSWTMPSHELVDQLSSCCERSFLQLSPETADEAVRKKNKKSVYYSNEEIDGLLEYCSTKDNLKVQLYFGYFMAYETRASIEKTVKYILYLVHTFPDSIEIAYSNYSTDPGSMIYTDPERYDIEMCTRTFQDYMTYITTKYRTEKSDDPDMLLFKPRTLTDDDMQYGERKVRLLQYLFMHYRKSVSCILRGDNGLENMCELMNSDCLLSNPAEAALVRQELLKQSKRQCSANRFVKHVEEEYDKLLKVNRALFKAKPHMWIYPEDAL